MQTLKQPSVHRLPLLLLALDGDPVSGLPVCRDFPLQICPSADALVHAWLEHGEGLVALYAHEHSEALEQMVSRLHAALPDAALVVIGAGDELRLLLLGVQEVIRRVDDTLNTVLHRAEVRRRAAVLQQHSSHYDDLTGLASRSLLQDRLEHSLVQGQRRNTDVGLLSIGINRFRLVNDLHGHRAGDELLIACARRMQTVLRRSDTIARMGGDNFAIVLEPISDEQVLTQVAGKISAAFEQPFEVAGEEIFLSLRCGMELGSRAGYDAGQMLRHADIAMHQARQDELNSSRLYRTDQAPADRIRAGLESGLYHALERDELYLVYQPQAAIGHDGFTGAEVLLRWQHPLLGNVPPAVFIPVLEETGLISRFGEWVLRNACQQFARWLQQGDVPEQTRLSVNLSPRQFAQPDLVTRVRSALQDSGLPARNLTLEITESTLMRNMEHGVKLLQELRALGVCTAIDDFGTGYSSLAYLKDLPVDYLKIDQAFVRDIVSNSHDAAIASSIISLAHNLGLNVVAEGVEDSETLEVLKMFGCDQYQGFYYARPLPPAELPPLAARHA